MCFAVVVVGVRGVCGVGVECVGVVGGLLLLDAGGLPVVRDLAAAEQELERLVHVVVVLVQRLDDVVLALVVLGRHRQALGYLPQLAAYLRIVRLVVRIEQCGEAELLGCWLQSFFHFRQKLINFYFYFHCC